MSALGEIFIGDELTEMASNANLLNLENEELIIPPGYYNFWSENNLPYEDQIEIRNIGGNIIDSLSYKLEFFVDDLGTGRFINHYVKSIERNGTTKIFENDEIPI